MKQFEIKLVIFIGDEGQLSHSGLVADNDTPLTPMYEALAGQTLRMQKSFFETFGHAEPEPSKTFKDLGSVQEYNDDDLSSNKKHG